MEIERFIGTGISTIDALEKLQEQYEADPQSVDPSWARLFENLDHDKELRAAGTPTKQGGDARVLELIDAYRTYGHLQADVNPLSDEPSQQPDPLKIETWGFVADELSNSFPTFGFLSEKQAPLSRIIDALKKVYCGKVGIEYVGFCPPEIGAAIQQRIEPEGVTVELTIDQKRMILQHLNKSEIFESFLQMKYPGQKRFSLEGGETLIPMLAGIIDKGAEEGIEEFVIGMAHRGRLNVLSNILNKSYVDVFYEFDEGYIQDSFEGTGDVKYHKGHYSETISSHGRRINVSVAPNPSHLEAVDPVVEGLVKAKQKNAGGFDKVFPLLIHGDASISGQGVIYETLQMSKLPGYSTGGTVHIVINNQIGFTTLPHDSRSTFYCTDIAKAFGAPIFHINAEDPEACFFTALLAAELRNIFNIDVFIDLVCYRKYGHNESDEPAYTQPLVYQKIRKKRPIRELYRDLLISHGVLEKELAEKLEREFKSSLQEALEKAKEPKEKSFGGKMDGEAEEGLLFKSVNTRVAADQLESLAKKIFTVPEGFAVNSKLGNLLKDRLSMLQGKEGSKPIDWGLGEIMAYATLLHEGYSVRLSGQDCCRGTFSHRHVIWVDQQTAGTYSPLEHVGGKLGSFDVYNSPLSEYAILGFEYGYSLVKNNTLVLWEAQFGDFCNGAQIMIDQFISTGEQKWGQRSDLILLLPHGYEGQGPEHSSARVERFLSLAGQNNMIIVNPTTPAQLFHLLRRQMIGSVKKPLIIFTPKGLLRHPECVSTLHDLTHGSFQEILEDPSKPERVEKLVCCTGRIYYDLASARAKSETDGFAIVRLEQLYPFNTERMQELLKHYKGFKECVWVQEEPTNMGACSYITPILQELLPEGTVLKIIGRPRSASPAVGSHALHNKEHKALLDALFGQRQPSIFDLAGEKK